MKVIRKYQLPPPQTRAIVALPVGCCALTIGTQREPIFFVSEGQEPKAGDCIGHKNVAYLWAMMDAEQAEALGQADIEIIGSGETFPDSTRHIGTYFDAPYVWHVIEHVQKPTLEA